MIISTGLTTIIGSVHHWAENYKTYYRSRLTVVVRGSESVVLHCPPGRKYDEVTERCAGNLTRTGQYREYRGILTVIHVNMMVITLTTYGK